MSSGTFKGPKTNLNSIMLQQNFSLTSMNIFSLNAETSFKIWWRKHCVDSKL